MPSTRRSRTPALTQTLQTVFNLQRFRPGQRDVIESALAGRDTLAVMPTGAGKSLCYQIPALHLPGMTIVVSPLISLMKDQVDKLGDLGVDASLVNSTLTTREELQALSDIADERPEFVMTTPERLSDPEFLATLLDKTIDLFVVDEAHCISQWGHAFRPAYLELAGALEQLGRPPVLALTATASQEVADDIVRQLGLRDVRIVNTGIYRPNLRYEATIVDSEDERTALVGALLAETPGAGIVYTSTIKHAEMLNTWLQGAGHDVDRYHGRLGASVRHDVQDRFMSDRLRVVVATNAFGMGIDKPDIRFVIHNNMPGSLDAYYQESGRAGRDGEQARCLLLYERADRRTHTFFMAGRYPTFDDVAAVWTTLERMKADASPVKASEVQERVGGVARSKVRVVLALFDELGVTRLHRQTGVSLLQTGLAATDFERMAEAYKSRADRDREKLERMIVYAQTAMCRWKKLVDYFGEEVEWEACGHCDNCARDASPSVGQQRVG